MAQPLVSIVLPTYNRAHMLSGAIESCLHQSYPNIELIIVNDGSTDNTIDMVTPYLESDERVCLINKANGGLPSALNLGFQHASGHFLTWTSDDNLYLPSAIAEMVQALGSLPWVDVVYCDMQIIDKEGKVTSYRKQPEPDHIGRSGVVGGCFLYRRAVFEALPEYSEEHVLNEDDEYWIRVKKHGFKFLHVSSALYLYRVHDESLSFCRQREVLLAAAKTRVEHITRPFERRKILAAAYGNAALWALAHEGSLWRALCDIIHGAVLFPLESTVLRGLLHWIFPARIRHYFRALLFMKSQTNG